MNIFELKFCKVHVDILKSIEARYMKLGQQVGDDHVVPRLPGEIENNYTFILVIALLKCH